MTLSKTMTMTMTTMVMIHPRFPKAGRRGEGVGGDRVGGDFVATLDPRLTRHSGGVRGGV